MVDKRSALDKEYLEVNMHELAHQWFGDLITSRSGAHHWLHESFATFFQMRYAQVVKGDEKYIRKINTISIFLLIFVFYFFISK